MYLDLIDSACEPDLEWEESRQHSLDDELLWSKHPNLRQRWQGKALESSYSNFLLQFFYFYTPKNLFRQSFIINHLEIKFCKLFVLSVLQDRIQGLCMWEPAGQGLLHDLGDLPLELWYWLSTYWLPCL